MQPTSLAFYTQYRSEWSISGKSMAPSNPYHPHLAWIDAQYDRMCSLVNQWAAINSGTENLAGLKCLTAEITQAFEVLEGDVRIIDLPPAHKIDVTGQSCTTLLAQAIHITKRNDAPLQVFLGIHMDTVYGEDHPFQTVQQPDSNTLVGPGVTDAKGGLAVMLIAIQALERSGLGNDMGWEILINSDEEIGSPGSAEILAQCAKRNHLGLVFEPALADGTLAGARGGSGNFTTVLRGKAAHAGREFHLGHNAIDAMGQLICRLSALNGVIDGATVNVGRVEGGGPVNIVPDLAICRFNIRIKDAQSQHEVDEHLKRILAEVGQREGIFIESHGGWTSPPKPMDATVQKLFENIASCGENLGLSIRWRDTGGVCDGNKLSAAGLPTIDTLGARGGGLHSDQEYLMLDSLTERAKLSAMLLMKLATGEIAWTN